MERLKKQLKWYFLLLLVAGTGLTWYAIFRESRNGLALTVLNIGQGDAIFIEMPNGNQILIDGGPNKKILSELAKIMPFYDKTINAIILTHPHEDHLNGLIDVLKNYKVGAVLESGNRSETAAYNEFEKEITKNDARHFLAKRGTKITLGDDAVLNILFPIFNIPKGDIHDQMVVGKLNYGKTNFMLTGDMEKNVEEYLTDLEKENLKSEVLKIGHHGSKTSTSENFLGWVSPKYAVISAGTKNKYGHPHKEVLDRLEKFSTQIFRTDLSGAIKIKTDGENIEFSK